MTYGFYPSIVAALRAEHTAEDHRGAGGLCRDAANEIERLRGILEEIQTFTSDPVAEHAAREALARHVGGAL